MATIDVSTNQLSYSNIGDGGLMVVRHVPTDGTLNAKVAPTTHTSAKDASYNNTNYKIAYLAQQQLRSFNFPFQLGNGGPDHDVSSIFINVQLWVQSARKQYCWVICGVMLPLKPKL